MKYFKHTVFSVLAFVIFMTAVHAQDGVYRLRKDSVTDLIILADGYMTSTTYTSSEFLTTMGGPYEYQDGKITIQTDFNSKEAKAVGKKHTLDFDPTNPDSGWEQIKSLDKGLDGVWEITGRYTDGKFNPIEHSEGRKTLKILKDGYFQWIAFDNEKKAFLGTGGGFYDYNNGVYTELIIFFSKDNSRVKTELTFKADASDAEWNHIGTSSKGDPIHETWGRIKF